MICLDSVNLYFFYTYIFSDQIFPQKERSLKPCRTLLLVCTKTGSLCKKIVPVKNFSLSCAKQCKRFLSFVLIKSISHEKKSRKILSRNIFRYKRLKAFVTPIVLRQYRICIIADRNYHWLRALIYMKPSVFCRAVFPEIKKSDVSAEYLIFLTKRVCIEAFVESLNMCFCLTQTHIRKCVMRNRCKSFCHLRYCDNQLLYVGIHVFYSGIRNNAFNKLSKHN